jgi:hypothetical protein
MESILLYTQNINNGFSAPQIISILTWIPVINVFASMLLGVWPDGGQLFDMYSTCVQNINLINEVISNAKWTLEFEKLN